MNFLSDFTKLHYQVNCTECVIVPQGLPLTFHITIFSPSLPIVISVHPKYNRSWLPLGSPGRAFPRFPIIGVSMPAHWTLCKWWQGPRTQRYVCVWFCMNGVCEWMWLSEWSLCVCWCKGDNWKIVVTTFKSVSSLPCLV